MLPAGYPASGVITESPQVPIYFDPLLAQTAHSHSTDLAVRSAPPYEEAKDKSSSSPSSFSLF